MATTGEMSEVMAFAKTSQESTQDVLKTKGNKINKTRCLKHKKPPVSQTVFNNKGGPDCSTQNICKETESSVSTVAEAGDEIIFKSLADFESFNKVSTILKDLENCNEKIILTKKEKKCLEELTNLATKIRAPLDDRQMHLFNKDVNKFSTNITFPETTDVTEKELHEAAIAIKESPSKVLATELNTVASYLSNLRNLIANREVTWATATENDYTQKAEISRLRSEVNHLRIVCTKRQTELADKERIIADKNKENLKLQRLIQKLKTVILQLEKTGGNLDEDELVGPKIASVSRNNNLKIMEDILMKEGTKFQRGAVSKSPEIKVPKAPGSAEPRKNQGPAALLANALYKARNAGNFVNF